MRTALVGETDHGPSDPRTVALMIPSMRLLAKLGLWPGSLSEVAAPLRRLRLVDDTGSAIRGAGYRVHRGGNG